MYIYVCRYVKLLFHYLYDIANENNQIIVVFLSQLSRDLKKRQKDEQCDMSLKIKLTSLSIRSRTSCSMSLERYCVW